MTYSSVKIAGTLLFIAASQFVLGMMVAEALYPDYSISANYISDLGVGPSANIFNSSVFLLGLLILVGTYYLHRAFNFTMLTVFLVLTAIGAMGVGVFTEDSPAPMHAIAYIIAFLFGGLSAIFSVICSYVHEFKLVKMPFSVIAVILGSMTLVASALHAGNIYFGLGPGGMERMIVYPILMWGVGFGGYLISHPTKETTAQKTQ